MFDFDFDFIDFNFRFSVSILIFDIAIGFLFFVCFFICFFLSVFCLRDQGWMYCTHLLCGNRSKTERTMVFWNELGHLFEAYLVEENHLQWQDLSLGNPKQIQNGNLIQSGL